jgi:hypothetical protein
VLHRRDASKVAHGGGLYQVMPVGVFQPSSAGDWNRLNGYPELSTPGHLMYSSHNRDDPVTINGVITHDEGLKART